MAAITQGQNSTFKSATLENFLIELCQFGQILEVLPDRNPTGVDNIIGTINQNTGVFSCNFTIPLTQEINSTTGLIQYVATDWISNVGITVGSGSTFKSSTYAGLLFEALIMAQNLERNTSKNPNSRNYITGRIDTDTLTFTGSINIPVTLTISDNGIIQFTAISYLT